MPNFFQGRCSFVLCKRHLILELLFVYFKMISKLFQEGVSINGTCVNGLTPLHIMQKKSRAECAIELLCLDADAKIGDQDGNTPLHYAAMVRFQLEFYN